MPRCPRRFSSGCTLLLIIIIGGALLVGCSSIKDRQARIQHAFGGIAKSASGAVIGAAVQMKETVKAGARIAGDIQNSLEDMKKRVEAVEEGVGKIKEGKEMIEEGLGRN